MKFNSPCASLFAGIMLASLLSACGTSSPKTQDAAPNPSPGAGQGGTGTGTGNVPGGFALSGQLPKAAIKAKAAHKSQAASTDRAVSHVMAVNPQATNPQRFVSAIDSNGSFALSLPPGNPYVLVLVDDSQRGLDMIVGIFQAQTLDTLAPITANGNANLGVLSIDGNTRVATAATGYGNLLNQLGLDANAALTLGAVDDISLRLANPDIDGDGRIDALVGQNYFVDFHVRTENMRVGDANGAAVTISDMVGRFLDSNGAAAPHVSFNLASIYAIYPSSFDSGTYVASPPSTTLLAGGSFAATLTNGSLAAMPSSFSQVPGGGDHIVWGPDYSLSSVEMPGSLGSPATLTYGVGGGNKTLTFPNVVTRTKAQLEASGTIVPFLRFNTSDGTDTGTLTSFDFKYMKRLDATTWTEATDQEVQLIVAGDGGRAGFYLNAKATGVGFNLPRSAAGNVLWTAAAAAGDGGASATQISTATPRDICSMAISYDDKLGLRIFAGNVGPATGVTPCY